MPELPFVFVAGLLGSSHCIGMCGPFAIMLADNKAGWKRTFGRQVTYNVGRLCTYSLLGAGAGLVGLRITQTLPATLNIPGWLALIAGTLLIHQGLSTAGVLRIPWRERNGAGCLSGSLLSHFLRQPSRTGLFVAGVRTGLLPCGLVYGFLGMAASSVNVATGMTLMLVFGLGTFPVMLATGCGGNLLSVALRTKLLRVAAWCVVLTGIVTVSRGVSFLASSSGGLPLVEACPLCP